MKRILILSILVLFVAASVYANSGRAVMPYYWITSGSWATCPIIFCAHYPTTVLGTADMTLKWCNGESGNVLQTDTKHFDGAGHQRFESGAGNLGFVILDWTSYDGGFIGCTGVMWSRLDNDPLTWGSLYHVPFVK